MKFAIHAAIAAIVFTSGAAVAAPTPPGSYQRTCRDIHAERDVLIATCRTRRGEWNFTTLRDYADCEGDIANVRGRLTCVRESDDDDDDDTWVPRGSYRRTCRRVQVEHDTLTAECVDRNGRWRYTELQNFRTCRGDIANANGMLRCRRASDDDDDGYDLPGGSWRYSCRRARLYGNVLFAECRDRFNNWRETSLDLGDCDGEVRNNNGRLACEYRGFAQIILYNHTNFAGASRTLGHDEPDLNRTGFGNKTSSVLIQGGLWELCDRPNYRGYCIVIDRSHPNLWVYGFNDRAESVRRIR
jgi:hypothetical protein